MQNISRFATIMMTRSTVQLHFNVNTASHAKNYSKSSLILDISLFRCKLKSMCMTIM